MQNLIVSDIFGRTAALEKIAAQLPGPTDIFDPYGSKYMDFENEAQAYAVFTSEVGLGNYVERLRQRIQTFTTELNLIGFSVGAAAIWRLSSQTEITNVFAATCFYGAQIRHDRDIQPKFPVQLIMAATEPHFSVAELIDDLRDRQNLKIEQSSFYHGFMNSHSKNYDHNGYRQYLQLLSEKAVNKSE